MARLDTRHGRLSRWLTIALLLLVSTAIAQTTDSVKVCEDSNAELSCPDDTVIRVTGAVYKQQDDSGPPEDECDIRTSQCTDIDEVDDDDVLEIVREECDGKNSCEVPAENDYFDGDPCKGHKKYLGIEWSCVGDGEGDGEGGEPKWIISAADDMRSFEDARDACRDQGNHLATVRSQTENDALEALIKETVDENEFVNSRWWIGAKKNEQTNSWRWSDIGVVFKSDSGAVDEFENWKGDQNSVCAAAEQLSDGLKWDGDANCDTAHRYICEIQYGERPKYYVSNDGILAMEQSVARDICIDDNRDLASVLSQEDNDEIVSLFGSLPGDTQRVWVGGKRDTTIQAAGTIIYSTWSWSDGTGDIFSGTLTPDPFTNWNTDPASPEPSHRVGEECMFLNTVSSPSGQWHDMECDNSLNNNNARYSFACGPIRTGEPVSTTSATTVQTSSATDVETSSATAVETSSATTVQTSSTTTVATSSATPVPTTTSPEAPGPELSAAPTPAPTATPREGGGGVTTAEGRPTGGPVEGQGVGTDPDTGGGGINAAAIVAPIVAVLLCCCFGAVFFFRRRKNGAKRDSVSVSGYSSTDMTITRMPTYRPEGAPTPKYDNSASAKSPRYGEPSLSSSKGEVAVAVSYRTNNSRTSGANANGGANANRTEPGASFSVELSSAMLNRNRPSAASTSASASASLPHRSPPASNSRSTVRGVPAPSFSTNGGRRSVKKIAMAPTDPSVPFEYLPHHKRSATDTPEPPMPIRMPPPSDDTPTSPVRRSLPPKGATPKAKSPPAAAAKSAPKSKSRALAAAFTPVDTAASEMSDAGISLREVYAHQRSPEAAATRLPPSSNSRSSASASRSAAGAGAGAGGVRLSIGRRAAGSNSQKHSKPTQNSVYSPHANNTNSSVYGTVPRVTGRQTPSISAPPREHMTGGAKAKMCARGGRDPRTRGLSSPSKGFKDIWPAPMYTEDSDDEGAGGIKSVATDVYATAISSHEQTEGEPSIEYV